MRSLLVSAALLNAAPVAAQISGSASVVSQYRYRGMPLSAGRPEPQFRLNHDGKAGWYAGIFASGIRLDDSEPGDAQVIGYAGVARRRPTGLVWEIGATQSMFLQTSSFNYAEVFAGFTSGNLNGRLYFSPDYFGSSVRTLYAEVNGTYPLHRRMELFGHVGFLRALSGTRSYSAYPANRRDMSVGANVSPGNWNMRLAWVAATKGDDDRMFYENGNPVWTFTLSYPF